MTPADRLAEAVERVIAYSTDGAPDFPEWDRLYDELAAAVAAYRSAPPVDIERCARAAEIECNHGTGDPCELWLDIARAVLREAGAIE